MLFAIRKKHCWFVLIILLLAGSPWIYQTIVHFRLKANLTEKYGSLDQWSLELSRAQAKDSHSDWHAVFERITAEHPTASQLRSQLMNFPLEQSLPTPRDYIEFTEALLRLRFAIVQNYPTQETRPLLHLVEKLIEASLSVYRQKFAGHDADFQYEFTLQYQNSTRLKAYDILLSRGLTLASSLLSFRDAESSAYSHADFLLPDQHRKLSWVTADIYGPVVSPIEIKQGYRQLTMRPRKILSPEPLFKKSVDFLDPGGDFLTKTQFNFSLKAGCGTELYCSQMIYCFYKDLEKFGVTNPYAEQYWNSAFRHNADFASFQSHGPEPEDLLLNPEYEPISEHLEVENVVRARLQNFVLDVFLTKMELDPWFRWKLWRHLQKSPRVQVQKPRQFSLNGLNITTLLPVQPPAEISSELTELFVMVSALVSPRQFDNTLQNQSDSELLKLLPQIEISLKELLENNDP